MRRLPAWALKSGAVCLTVLATFGSAGYVGANVKSPAAPLRPPLRPGAGLQAPAAAAVQLNVPPAMRDATGAQPATETYSS